MSTLDRLIAKVDVGNSPAGCWMWTASRLGDYGSFQLHGRTCLAHRASYELHVGPIPGGLQIDHLCRETLCVNPLHLEPVTPSENTRRGDTRRPGNGPMTGTHCRTGHAFDAANTYTYPNGKRACRTCMKDRQRERRRKNKENTK